MEYIGWYAKHVTVVELVLAVCVQHEELGAFHKLPHPCNLLAAGEDSSLHLVCPRIQRDVDQTARVAGRYGSCRQLDQRGGHLQWQAELLQLQHVSDLHMSSSLLSLEILFLLLQLPEEWYTCAWIRVGFVSIHAEYKRDTAGYTRGCISCRKRQNTCTCA